MRVRLLLTAIALPLLLWALVPMPSSGQSKAQQLSELQSKIDKARDKIGRKRGTERALSKQIAGYNRRIGRLQGQITTLQTRQQRVQTDLDAKRAELERLRSGAARRARPARAPAQAPRRDAHPAARPARRDLQGRAAGHRHRRAELRRLHRPARARRVHQAHLRPGPPASSTSCATRRPTRSAARSAWPSSRRASARSPRSCSSAATRSPPCGWSSSARASATRARRTARRRRCCTCARRARTSSQHVDSLEKASSRIAAQLGQLQGQYAGDLPIRRGNGSMIWPVNGPVTGVFGEARPGPHARRPGHRGRRGHADPRRRRRPGRAHPGHRRSRAATATSPACSTPRRCRRATRTSRASARASARA